MASGCGRVVLSFRKEVGLSVKKFMKSGVDGIYRKCKKKKTVFTVDNVWRVRCVDSQIILDRIDGMKPVVFRYDRGHNMKIQTARTRRVQIGYLSAVNCVSIEGFVETVNVGNAMYLKGDLTKARVCNLIEFVSSEYIESRKFEPDGDLKADYPVSLKLSGEITDVSVNNDADCFLNLKRAYVEVATAGNSMSVNGTVNYAQVGNCINYCPEEAKPVKPLGEKVFCGTENFFGKNETSLGILNGGE